MAIFKDIYSTTVGKAFVIKPIEQSIKESIIKDSLDRNFTLDVRPTDTYKAIFITGYANNDDNIPNFIHPITILNFNNNNYICTDLRLYLRKDGNINDINGNIRNITEYNFSKSRAILSMLWASGEYDRIKNSLKLASSVFSTWISDAISKTYALDPRDQLILTIITNFYYQSLFSDKKEFDENDKQRMAIHTINATKAPADFVFKVFDQITTMSGAEDYCKTVIEILANIKLEKFNLASLLTIVNNSWYGTNAKQILSVAIEHPPTWIAIVFSSLNERTYKNSLICKIAEKQGQRGMKDEFNKNYVQMMQSQIVNISQEEIVIRDYE